MLREVEHPASSWIPRGTPSADPERIAWLACVTTCGVQISQVGHDGLVVHGEKLRRPVVKLLGTDCDRGRHTRVDLRPPEVVVHLLDRGCGHRVTKDRLPRPGVPCPPAQGYEQRLLRLREPHPHLGDAAQGYAARRPTARRRGMVQDPTPDDAAPRPGPNDAMQIR